MSASRQKKRVWEKRFERINLMRAQAERDWLVMICEARRDGLSQADVAYMAEGVSPSGVKAKEEKGAEILQEREKKRGAKTQ